MSQENPVVAQDPVITVSQQWLSRAEAVIPSVTQTLAKGPTQYVRGISPIYLKQGRGAHVWDVDGNRFLDFNMAVGPVSLGYAYPRVDEAIRSQLESGITFSLMHPLEVEVAESIQDVVPNAEAVRFSKSGADVTSAAIRLSRAFTGRNKIACCGYHGWHDWYIGVTSRDHGVPESVKSLTVTFQYNNLESLKRVLDKDVAAVILEPVLFEPPNADFLHQVKALCQKNGSLLIFDEMWTGFRLALGGAQEFFGITADLVTFSKAIANGMPLSVLTGRWDVMKLCEEDVFFYTTFGGETLSLAAAHATIQEMKEKKVTSHLHAMGDLLKQRLNDLIASLEMPYLRCVGYGPRTMMTFSPEGGDPLLQKSLVQQELIRRGILWSGAHVLSFSHDESHISCLIRAYEEVLPKLKSAVCENALGSYLRGKPVQPVFRTVTGDVSHKRTIS